MQHTEWKTVAASQIRFLLSREESESSWLTRRVRSDKQDDGRRVSKLKVKAPALKIFWIWGFWKARWLLPVIYIYIYAFSRCFYPKRLTVHSGYTCFVSNPSNNGSFFNIHFSFIWFHICRILFSLSCVIFFCKNIISPQGVCSPCLQTSKLVLLINVLRFIIICSSVLTDFQFCIPV